MTILRRCFRSAALVAIVFAIAALVATPRYGAGGVGIIAPDGQIDADGGVRPLGPSVVALANTSAVIAAPVVAPVVAPIDGETAAGSVPVATHRAAIRAWDTQKVRSDEGRGRGFDRSLARVDRC